MLKSKGICLALLLCDLGLPPGRGLAAAVPETLDLMPFARVTASGTRNTFLGLWPRETDDAPGTVRDGDPETGWKIPAEGEQRLILDFSPLEREAPRLAALSAEWSRGPVGPVRLRAYAFCGGPLVREEAWTAPDEPLALDPPVEAACLELVFRDAGPADLAELHAYAAPGEGVPAISDVRLEEVPETACTARDRGPGTARPGVDAPGSDMSPAPVHSRISSPGGSSGGKGLSAVVVGDRSLRIAWAPQGATHHVEIHYVPPAPEASGQESRSIETGGLRPSHHPWRPSSSLTGSGTGEVMGSTPPFRDSGPISGKTLAAVAGPDGPWDGPFPAGRGACAVLVPVARDGTRGPAHSLPLPAGALPRLESSGVVEGFYGRPWSHAERRRLVLFLARAGLGLYIYAPKNDPLHRDRWRSPYDEQALDRFEELHALGRSVGVTFSLGISPGRDMDTGDPGERAVLLGKLEPFVSRGFRHFTLLFDDIEFDLGSPVDRELAARHVDLANWLEDALAEQAGEPVSLWFVPTVYSTERQDRWPGGTDYLEELSGLAPGVTIMWTGTDTFSQTLEAADLAEVTALTGRPPAIWENEHATDGGDGFFGKVYLAPYLNRGTDLAGAVEGITANPMILGAANRLMLGAYAAYLHDPERYEPVRAQEEWAGLEAGEGPDLELAVRLTRSFHGCAALGFPGINLPRYPALDQAIDDFRAALTSGDRPRVLDKGGRLLELAAGMAVAQDELHHSGLDVSLVDDLWVPTDRLTHEGRALLWLLRWSGSALAGSPDEASWEEAGEALLEALVDRYPVSLLKVELFRESLRRKPPAVLGFEPPVPLEPPARPVAGQVWQYRPSAAAGVRVRMLGLAGSTLAGDTVSWVPPHPGVFRPVVVLRGEGGWAWRALELVVEPALRPLSPPAVAAGGGDGGGLCFVATAVYGSGAEGKIEVLRGFRDSVLLRCRPGRMFVKAYCRYGPSAASFIRERPRLRSCARLLLLPAVGFASLFSPC